LASRRNIKAGQKQEHVNHPRTTSPKSRY